MSTWRQIWTVGGQKFGSASGLAVFLKVLLITDVGFHWLFFHYFCSEYITPCNQTTLTETMSKTRNSVPKVASIQIWKLKQKESTNHLEKYWIIPRQCRKTVLFSSHLLIRLDDLNDVVINLPPQKLLGLTAVINRVEEHQLHAELPQPDDALENSRNSFIKHRWTTQVTFKLQVSVFAWLVILLLKAFAIMDSSMSRTIARHQTQRALYEEINTDVSAETCFGKTINEGPRALERWVKIWNIWLQQKAVWKPQNN